MEGGGGREGHVSREDAQLFHVSHVTKQPFHEN